MKRSRSASSSSPISAAAQRSSMSARTESSPGPPRRLIGTASPHPMRAVVGGEPDDQHLAAVEPAARGHVGLGRTGARPGSSRAPRSAWPGSDQQSDGDEEREGAEQGAGAGEGAVQGRPVGALADRPGPASAASGRLSRPSRPQAEPSPADQGDRQQHVGEDDHRHVEAAAPLTAEPHGEGALAGAAVGVDVADVVDDEDRRREQADRDRQQDRQGLEVLELDVVGAVDRDEPEEDEDEDLAEALVAVRLRAAGVEDAGGDREDPDREDLGPTSMTR